jgi:hypothetical protein
MELIPVKMSDKRFTDICRLITQSYPNACVLWVEHVENSALRKRYDSYKNKTECEELQLFHGTKEENIKIIASEGFDASRNRVSAYGKGTYFAKHANYSKTYAINSRDGISFMFICNVAVAEAKCNGKCNCVIDVTRFGCAVDDIRNPQIYVIPSNDAAYPEYIVAFYQNAR